MFFYLSKILLFLIKPLIWVMGILLFGIITKDEQKRKRRLVIASLLLYLLSNNFLVNEAFVMYEERNTYSLDSSYGVGLVLGGFSKEDTSLERTVFFEANDRLMQAILAYRKGQIRKIMISSGNANVFNTELKEGDAVRLYLLGIGIPDSALIVENQSRNTIENIKFSKRILDSLNYQGKILVFTSAWHIPRARLCTSGQMDVDYFATNHFGDPKRDYTPANLLVPSAKALSNIELLMKELVGYVFYLLKVS